MPDEITPRRKVVAMRYQLEKDAAPRIVAKGEGYVAERILEIAEEHGITLYNDPDLTAVLSRLDINQEVPEHLYRAIAEVLAFVYRLNEAKS